jgi:putative IMPACT (imprinted ancient) family translation regulator|tara:strand:+ start:6633 stop:6848 length:216 start_codon:yes stop_codon:yes gene_type:complete
MKALTDLYQALANARKTVKDIEQAIEKITKSQTEERGGNKYYTKYRNADTNGNYTRDDFYIDAEKESYNDR